MGRTTGARTAWGQAPSTAYLLKCAGARPGLPEAGSSPIGATAAPASRGMHAASGIMYLRHPFKGPASVVISSIASGMERRRALALLRLAE